MVPLTVFDAEAFAEMLVAPPNVNGAVTVVAFADVAGFDNATRTVKLVPAMYVPLPLCNVKPVMARLA